MIANGPLWPPLALSLALHGGLLALMIDRWPWQAEAPREFVMTVALLPAAGRPAAVPAPAVQAALAPPAPAAAVPAPPAVPIASATAVPAAPSPIAPAPTAPAPIAPARVAPAPVPPPAASPAVAAEAVAVRPPEAERVPTAVPQPAPRPRRPDVRAPAAAPAQARPGTAAPPAPPVAATPTVAATESSTAAGAALAGLAPRSAAAPDAGGSGVEDAVPLPGNPHPVYPYQARRMGIVGRVVLEAEIDPQGRVVGVRIVESSGHPILDRAAHETVRGWRFRPASRDGRPVAASARVPVIFRLEG